MWRFLDTGRRRAHENIALDYALLRGRATGSPNTVRLMQFSSPSALIGYHQTVTQEIREGFCRENGIDINRRITGGGAILFDKSQLGWEVIASREEFGHGMEQINERISQAVILALKKFGLDAEFRPRNDIEIEGRKISGLGGIFDEENKEVFLLQGTLLMDFDVVTMLKALRIPTEKLADKEIDRAQERVTWMKKELGYLPEIEAVKEAIREGFETVLGKRLEESGLSDQERRIYREKAREFSSASWLNLIDDPSQDHRILRSSYKGGGGIIKTFLSVDLKRGILKSILITGDFFVSPQRTIYDLEAYLKDTYFDQIKERLFQFFSENQPEILGLGREDFWASIHNGLRKADFTRFGIPLEEANYLSLVNWNGNLEGIIKNAEFLLLPYCAKFTDCDFRYEEGCEKCGKCSVGHAYELAEVNNLTPVSIQSYEHLREVLHDLRERGTQGYIGCCCEAFFNKRQRLFREAGIPGLLIDIENKTCYDLGKELDAYEGRFENQTSLRMDLLSKLIRLRENGTSS